MKNIAKSILLVSFTLLISCKEGLVTENSDCIIAESTSASELITSVDETKAIQDSSEISIEPRVCNLPSALGEKEIQMEVNAYLRNFTSKQETKMRESLRRLKIVINSTEFKQRVLAHKYKDQVAFADSDGLSNEQIYDKLMEGAETLDPIADREIDLDFTMYYKRNNTIGYTYPSTNRIWVNSRFFTSASYGKVAANALHEWSHKVGFGHDFKSTSKRPFSVPYGVGTIIKELVDSM